MILSADEVVRFFAAVPSLKHRTALMTAYAAGLRVSEVVCVELIDIDSNCMLIRVEQGKGGRNRYIMLSSQLLVGLRAYWREARPVHWLFPAHGASARLIQPSADTSLAPAGLLLQLNRDDPDALRWCTNAFSHCLPACRPERGGRAGATARGFLGIRAARSVIERSTGMMWLAKLCYASNAARSRPAEP